MEPIVHFTGFDRTTRTLLPTLERGSWSSRLLYFACGPENVAYLPSYVKDEKFYPHLQSSTTNGITSSTRMPVPDLITSSIILEECGKEGQSLSAMANIILLSIAIVAMGRKLFGCECYIVERVWMLSRSGSNAKTPVSTVLEVHRAHNLKELESRRPSRHRNSF